MLLWLHSGLVLLGNVGRGGNGSGGAAGWASVTTEEPLGPGAQSGTIKTTQMARGVAGQRVEGAECSHSHGMDLGRGHKPGSGQGALMNYGQISQQPPHATAGLRRQRANGVGCADCECGRQKILHTAGWLAVEWPSARIRKADARVASCCGVRRATGCGGVLVLPF